MEPINTIPVIVVEPEAFLYDYKIFIFSFLIIFITVILKICKRDLKDAFLPIVLGDVCSTIIYIIRRIEEVKSYGYTYKFATNSSFDELIGFFIIFFVIFLIAYLGRKLISKIKRRK